MYQPPFQSVRLWRISAMTNQLNPSAKFAYGNNREEYGRLVRRDALEEVTHSGVGSPPFVRLSLTTLVSSRYIGGRLIVVAGEILIGPDIRHCRQCLGKRLAPGPRKRRFQDRTVLRLGATAMPQRP